MKKNQYEQPSTELLVVRTEGNFCTTFDPNNNTETFKDDGEEDLNP